MANEDQPPRSPVSDILQETGLGSLGEKAAPDAIETALRRLHAALKGADDLRVAMAFEATVFSLKKAGVAAPKKLLDAAMIRFAKERKAEGREELQGREITWEDPELPDEPVDGAELLVDLVGTIMTYLVLPEGGPLALALWLLHAHAHAASSVSPRFVLKSPEKRCGKTTTLTLVGALAPRVLPASNITAAAVFRSIERFYPTLVIDEADTFLRDSEELRGVLNSGHLKSGFVVRCVGEDFEPRQFGTFCPVAIAVIGDLAQTLEDRSIIIPMRRKVKSEKVQRLRLDRLEASVGPLRAKCAKWAADNLELLTDSDPEVPDQLHDRAADNWRPLLAIADLIGGDWREHARNAALVLSGTPTESNDSVRVLLLRDIRDSFRTGEDRLASEDLIRRLIEREDRPWREWGKVNPKPITASGLARQLKPFGIVPTQAREGADVRRGYSRVDLADAWARYVPPQQAVTPATSLEVKRLCSDSSRDNNRPVTGGEDALNPHAERVVTSVTGPGPEGDAQLPLLGDLSGNSWTDL